MSEACVDLQVKFYKNIKLGSDHILQFQNQIIVPSQNGLQIISGQNIQLLQVNLPEDQTDRLQQSQQREVVKTDSYYMRFDKQNVNNLTISPSGLLCTNTDVKEQKGFAVCTKGFSSGSHYWEIICPLSCDGIEVGIIKKGWDINSFSCIINCHLLQFKTTTQRIIGLKLNLDEGSLKCWLNGNFHDKKGVGIGDGEKIVPGEWFPLVVLRGMGNSLMINPFAVDPDVPMSLYSMLPSLNHVVKNEQISEQEIKNTIQKVSFLNKRQIVVSKSKIQVAQVSNKNLILLQNNRLKSINMNQGKVLDQSIIVDNCPKVSTDIVTLQVPTNELGNLLHLIDWLSYNQLNDEILWRQFIQSVTEGEAEQKVYTFKISFINAITFLSQLIQYLQNNLIGQNIMFSNLRKNQQEEQQQPVKSGIVESTLDGLKNLMGSEDTNSVQQQIGQPIQTDTTSITQPKKIQIETLSYEQTFVVLTTVLNLNEQLQAMSLHQEASSEIKDLLNSGELGGQSRLFSAFARLNTFTDTVATNNPQDLAEEGFFKRPGHQLSYGHFLQPNLDVEIKPNQSGQEIANLLQDNRMLNGRLCGNVDLSQTINNIPSQKIYSDGNDVVFLKKKMVSPYFGVHSKSDDKVHLYNGELTIQQMCQVDLRQFSKITKLDERDSQDPQVQAQIIPNIELEQKSAVTVITDIFKILENYSNMEKVVSQVPEEDQQNFSIGGLFGDQEPDFPLNEDFVGQLHAMGFPINVCKKALQRTQNDLDKAVDTIFDVQKELQLLEQSQNNTNKKFKSQLILKPEWLCLQCTLINIDSEASCEACETPAPQSAYYDPSVFIVASTEETKESSTSQVDLQQQLAQQQAQKQEELKQQTLEAQEKFRNCLSNKQLTDISECYLVEGIESSLSPVIICTVFNPISSTGSAALSIKQVSYSQDYLKTFFISVDNLGTQNDRGFVSIISNEWVPEQLTPENIQNTLLSNPFSNYLVRTLYPVFKPDQKQEFLVQEETLIEFSQGQHILKSDYIKQKNIYTYFTLVQDNTSQSKLLFVHELINNINPNLKQTIRIDVQEQVNDLQIHLIHNEVVCIMASDTQLIQFNLNDLESPVIRNITPKLSINQKILYFTAGTTQIHLLLQDSNKTNLITLNHDQQNYTVNPTYTSENLDSLSSDELQKLESLVENEPIKFQSNSTYCSGALNDNVRKHSLSRSFNQQILTLKSTTPSTIINLDVDVLLTRISQQKVTSENLQFNNLLNENELNQTLEQASVNDVKGFFNKSNTSGVTDSDQQIRLPLTIHSFTGSQFNLKTLVTKFLYPNEHAFTPNYPNAEFVLRHLHGKRMNPITVTVESGLKNINCGFPIGSGLIFTADHPSQFNLSSCFDGMDKHTYKQWAENRKNFPQPIQPWEPVGCFEFELSIESLTIPLDVQRPCNYMLLKPTNFRKTPYDNSIHFKKNPLEIKQFLSTGYEVKQQVNESHNSYLNQRSKLIDALLSQLTIKVKYHGTETFEVLENIQDAIQISENLIDQLEYSQHGLNKIKQLNVLEYLVKNGISVDSSLKVRLTHKKLQNNEVDEIQFHLSGEHQDWEVTYLTVSGSKPIDLCPSLSRNFKELRCALLNIESFDKVNAKILQMITDSTISLDRRVVAIKLLIKIINNVDVQILERTFNELNFKKFIELNMLTIEEDVQEQAVTQLLSLFESRSQFPELLSRATLQILKDLQSEQGLGVTQRGLGSLIKVIRFLSDWYPQEILSTLTEQFNHVLDHIDQIKKDHPYQKLTDLGLYASYFDTGLFSTQYLNLIGINDSSSSKHSTTIPSENYIQELIQSNNDAHKLVVCEQKAIPSRFIQQLSKNQNQMRSFMVDLLGEYDLERILLRFSHHDHFMIRFRVQIWAHCGTTKYLLVDESCGEWTHFQVVSLSYKNMTLGKDLECLGYALNNFRARYLQIQITYGQTATIKRPADTSNIPQGPVSIIPELFGSLVQGDTTKSIIPHLNGQFELIDRPQLHKIFFQKNVVVGGSLTYQRYDLKSNVQLLDSAQVYENTNSSRLNWTKNLHITSERKTEVSKDQTKNHNLNKQLMLNQENLGAQISNPNLNNQQIIQNTANKILSIQRQLHELQPCISSNNLSFQYTYCYHILLLLRDIHHDLTKQPQQQMNSKQSLAITDRIFYGLLLEDEGPLVMQARNFLSEQLVNNINEGEWIRFTLGAYETQDLDGQIQLSKNLKEIPIPLRETIHYISINLNYKNVLIENSIQKQVVGSSQSRELGYSRLVSLLGVLVGWFMQVPTHVVGQHHPSSKFRNIQRFLEPPQQIIQVTDHDSLSLVFNVVVSQSSELLQRVFHVCQWISQQQLEREEFDSLFSLAVDLMVELIRVSKSSEVVELLSSLTDFDGLTGDPHTNHLSALIISVLKINSPSSTNKLQVLLESLFRVHDIPELYKEWLSVQSLDDPLRQLVMAEKSSIGYVRRSIIFSMHLLLADIVWYRGGKPTSYSGQITSTQWIEHLQFVIDFLTYSVDQLNMDIKDLQSPKMDQPKRRKYSTDLYTIREQYQNFILKTSNQKQQCQLCPSWIVNDLVKILNQDSLQQSDFAFSHSIWQITFRVVLRIKPYQILEQKLFESIVTVFLRVRDEVQQTMFTEILTLTNNLLQSSTHYQKDLSKTVLNVLFETITSYYSSANRCEIQYNLIKGWLSILQPIKSVTRMKIHPLTIQTTQSLLNYTANFLYSFGQFGGMDGVQAADVKTLQCLEVADGLVQLLVASEDESETPMLRELFASHLDADVQTFSKLIQWSIVNHSVTTGSPSQDLMCRISECVFRVFERVGENQRHSSMCLKELFRCQYEVNGIIIPMLQKHKLSVFACYGIVQRSQKLLESLFDLWIMNDDVAREVAFNGGGFDYILDKMGISKGPIQQEVVQEEPQLINQVASRQTTTRKGRKQTLKGQSQALIPAQQFQSSPITQSDDLKEEELATNITLINLPGQEAGQPATDWSINKKSVKTRILLLSMSGNHQDEYQLVVKLDRVCEIKDLFLGFQVFTTDLADKVLGCPSAVYLELSLDQTIYYPVGRMSSIQDESYTNNCIRVFSKNFLLCNLSSPSTNLESYLHALQHMRVQYLKFRIQRPQITIMEGYAAPQKSYKNISLAISFLSIRGHDVSKLPEDFNLYINNQQERSALNIIGKLCAPRFSKTLYEMANNELLLKKVKHSFEKIAQSLTNYEDQLSPLILAIAKHNSQLGDWIVEQFLDQKRSVVHAKLLNEIILSSSQESVQRVTKLHNFVMRNLTDNDQQMTPFIDSYCVVLLLSAKNQQLNELSEPQALPFTFMQMQNLITMYSSSYQLASGKLLIKLIVSLCYMPYPYQLEDESIVTSTLTYVWQEAMLNNNNMLELLAPLVIGCEASINWFLSDNKLTRVVDQLQVLMQDPHLDIPQIRCMLWFLNALSQIPSCAAMIIKEKQLLRIYRCMFVEHPRDTLIKKVSQPCLDLLTQFISSVIQSHPLEQVELVKQLIQDIQRLSDVRDMQFVSHLLVPLLNSERMVPVCLNFWDAQSRRYIIDPRKLVNMAQKGTLSDLMNPFQKDEKVVVGVPSKILTQEDNLRLQEQLNKCSLPKDQTWQLVLSQQLDSDESVVSKLLDQILLHPQFMIVVKCLHQSQERRIVIYLDKIMSKEECDDEYEFFYSMNNSKDAFAYCSDDKHHTFKAFTESLCEIHSYDNQMDLSLSIDDTVNLNFSYVQGKPSSIVFPLQGDPEALEYLFQEVEYWVYKTPHSPLQNKFVSITGQILTGLSASSTNLSSVTPLGLNQLCFSNQFYKQDSPYNYFRATPTYSLPANLVVNQLVDLIQMNQMSSKNILITSTSNENLTLSQLHVLATTHLTRTNGVVDVEVNALQLIESLVSQPLPGNHSYPLEMCIFSAFEQQDGVKSIIKVVQDGIKKWKNLQRAKVWSQYIDELWSFCFLPSFFNTFMKNKQCVELLFQLLAGAPDELDKSKKWDDEEQTSVKFIYQTLIEIFKTQNTSQVRELALEKDLLARILDRIAIVSKEKKRSYSTQVEKQEVQSVDSAKVSDVKKLPQKKKGVGYASDNTGQNTKWNTQEYVDSKKVRNEQLKTLLAIAEQFFDFNNWHIGVAMADKLLKTLYESALLPLLEAAFRSGSLLEMTKEADLYQGYMRLVQALAKHRVLAPIFLDIPRNYLPEQCESLQTLMTNLKGNAQIYLNCMSTSNVTNEEQSQAVSIINAHKAMEDIINRFQLQQSDSDEDLMGDELLKRSQKEDETANELIKEILQKPLAESYRLLLQDLRFDYVSMKENNKYKHHYSSSIQPNYTPSQNKLVRLAQEFADMSTALPIEHTNAIFCRADKERADVMKAMVMGAKGTPYAHGAYVFDIYFDDNYPNGPPKMNLSTTGAGKVRFNPNLYSCGKVCLSLLGTWRGNASENWDSKISTLLQVVVSTQAIIMSEEVYFNEPGFEGEAGTEEGERKNEAYSNIVRYSNIKFAMIQQLRNPPKGFETVIKRHFYLKKEEILEECHQWVTYAEQREASYTGLINDHNSNWCTEFKSSKTKYKEMLVEAIKELQVEFDKLQAPSASDLKGTKLLNQATRRLNKSPKKQRLLDIKDGMANLDDVDVSDDKVNLVREMNVQDESVRDRWSRYIGAMGLDAVQKQSNASVFLSGVGALGIEIAKNVILSGVKRFSLHDTSKVQMSDLAGQFFLTEEDLGLNRAQQSLNKIQQLNYYVRVDTLQCEVELPDAVESIEQQFPTLKTYQAIILAKYQSSSILVAWSQYCRTHKIKLIVCSVQGVHARLINDWGDEHVVIDKNGEQGSEVMIKEISIANPGVVELLTGSKHDLEDGDIILINNVQGMLSLNKSETPSINGTYHKVKVINKGSFFIEDTTTYSEFIRNGTVKLVKVPIPIKFQPLETVLANNNPTPPFDQFLSQSDFMKMDNHLFSHIAYQTMNVFVPKPWNQQDLQQFLQESKQFSSFYITEETKLNSLQEYLTNFALTGQVGEFAPLSAFFGGFAASELIKSLTNKFMPVHQIYYTDCTELLPELDVDVSVTIQKINVACKDNSRKSSLICLLGESLTNQLEETKLFMIGCGAIGCELLKNFAMLNIGVSGSGSITITDPDHIETSNLNRQFLFREKHIRKPKSSTAAAAVIQMNSLLKGRIVARFDKVYEATENVFTDSFFSNLTIVTNALDNIQARRYVDLRCVTAKVPLLESGTLGTKGHVQVILPYQTESYGSSNDPVEEGDIPYCTLKMFPEETFHCIEFARDKFGKLFTLRPKAILKILEDPLYKPTSPEEIKALREAVKLAKNIPANFDECVVWARRKFQKYFVNDIKQLLYTYPLDQKTKEGKNFWTMPKRPPQDIEYDTKNALHVQFVSTFAYLRANLFNLKFPKEWRSQENRNLVAEQATKATVKDWVPSEEKKKSIANQVLKTEKKDQLEQEDIQDVHSQSLEQEQESLLKELVGIRLIQISLKPEEFEKDEDQNGHIDFIHAFGNLRAANYKLEEMDWLTVKIKAGRIVPALATTTAVVAGLQTIELCKTIKQCKLEKMKNAFINLATPYIQLTEPATAPKTKLHEELIVNLWDRWDHVLTRQAQLKDLFEILENKYQLVPTNIFLKSAPIYMAAVLDKAGKENEKENILNSKLTDLLGLDKDESYIDLTINFTKKNSTEILQGVPIVRIIFE